MKRLITTTKGMTAGPSAATTHRLCGEAATRGNMNAERPYESDGEACSGCEGSCVDRLCRNKERDSKKSYSWTPDMDQALPAADHHYVYILVVRPICLILTFIASYAVHCFYPDVFCYE